MISSKSVSNYTDDISHAVAATTGRTLQAGQHAALDAMDSLRSNSRQLRNLLLDSRDGTLRYMRNEPAKAVMIAAAAGVVILGLATLLAQLRRRD